MRRQTWLRRGIPTNTRAPLTAYTCLILGQISPCAGILRCDQDDSFNHGEDIRQKSFLLSGCLRPLAGIGPMHWDEDSMPRSRPWQGRGTEDQTVQSSA